ncbi:putative RING-H2 finger protein ATL71 [Cardamine amara subsp. amara]|uniref:RING-H2 finger protein ATL71 n=1 Tax=Cardamine amara subsp. amara TaxID=228776 RepID=A0ABD0ZQU7_CARAN
MRSVPPSPSPAYTENNTHHHHLHEDFTLMIIIFVLYGIVAIRYATIRGTNLRFYRPQQPLPLPPTQPPMCPRQIEAMMVKDIVVDVELCCPICLEDLNKVDDDDDGGDKVVVCLPMCNHSFHMNCIFYWLRQSQDCPLCRTSVYRGEVTLINNGVGDN